MSTSTTQFLASWGKLRIFLYTLLSSLLIPIVIIISIPFLMFRVIHQFWTKKQSKSILKILDPLAQILAHDFFKSHPRLNIVSTIIGEGDISIEALQDLISNLIHGNYSHCNENSNGDKKKKHSRSISEYAELTCRVVKLGGFFYWEKIRNFDITNYVKMYSCPQSDLAQLNRNNNNSKKLPTTKTTEGDLKKIIVTLTSDAWDHESSSPWEIFLINNYIDNSSGNGRNGSDSDKSVIIIRMHHHMADGYSMLKFVKLLSAGNFKVNAVPHSNLKRKLSPAGHGHGLWASLLVPLVFPYQLALMFDTITRPKSKSWRLTPEQCQSVGDKYFYSWSSGVPVVTVKAIKNKFRVSFQAVLISVLGGAIHKLMKRMKQTSDGDAISSVVPIPLPGHPGGLCNYFGYMVVNIPVGDTKGPTERLDLAAKELSALSKSPFPIMSYIVYEFAGLFPGFMTEHVISDSNVGNSIGFSPFPAMDGDHYIGGLKVCFIMGTVGTGWGDTGACITTCSSQEQLRFGITIDQHICPSQDILDEFSQFVQDEFQMLIKCQN